MSWATAHRVAHIAAVYAHHDLGMAPGQFPVPVETAITAAGLPLLWRPLGQLFGIYLQVQERRGILVNEQLTRSGRRHTAAHELGHHRFRHALNPGTPCAVDTGQGPAPDYRWTPTERTAEAFADWFLMPAKAVSAALAELGLDQPEGPADVYQLSLLLGTSYRATVRHLVSLRLASPTEGRAWAADSPGVLKRQLLVAPLPTTRDVDVWLIPDAPISDRQVERHLSPGDRVVLPGRLLMDTGGLPVAANGPDRVVLVAPAYGTHPLQLIATDGRPTEVRLVVEPRPHGDHRPDRPAAAAPDDTEATA
jgi:hypothetical protein